MQIQVLSSRNQSKYWQFVEKGDRGDFYFFIFDLLLQPQKSNVWIALEDEQVAGLMLVFDGCMVQLRGTPQAVAKLLDALDLEFVELQAPFECEKEVLAKFPAYQKKGYVTLMTLKSDKETLAVTDKVERLNENDFFAVAQLMKDCYPEIWDDMTAESVKRLTSAEGTMLFGIKQAGKLVAFGSTMATPTISHIIWLATHKQWRRRGYASSILSTMVQQNRSKADKTIIYVMEDNPTAKQLYSKAGFVAYKTYFFLKT